MVGAKLAQIMKLQVLMVVSKPHAEEIKSFQRMEDVHNAQSTLELNLMESLVVKTNALIEKQFKSMEPANHAQNSLGPSEKNANLKNALLAKFLNQMEPVNHAQIILGLMVTEDNVKHQNVVQEKSK